MIFVLCELAFFAVLLLADLLSKQYLMPFLEAHDGFWVLIDKVLTLRAAYNEGAGFSMLAGKQGALIAITVVAMVAILGFTVYIHLHGTTRKRSGRFLAMIMAMILAGGIGNLVDRIAFGKVRDFIEYTFVETLFHKSFAICNIADVWITVGMILLVIYVIFCWKGVKGEDKPKEPDDLPDEDNIMAGLTMWENKVKEAEQQAPIEPQKDEGKATE